MYFKSTVFAVCLAWQLGLSLASTPCYDKVKTACGKGTEYAGFDGTVCTAEWGAFPRLGGETNRLISLHLNHSMQYLLTASYFNEWNVNRPGFNTFFSKLADEEWESAISLMIHMIKRGGQLDESFRVELPKDWNNRQNEIESLGWALDLEKYKANKTLYLAYLANHVPKDSGVDPHNIPRDAEFADFMAERLSDTTVLRIKHLSNYVNTLSKVLQSGVDKAYALFTFDREILV